MPVRVVQVSGQHGASHPRQAVISHAHHVHGHGFGHKPTVVTTSPVIFSFNAVEDEVYPAFPVSPEDKIQVLTIGTVLA